MLSPPQVRFLINAAEPSRVSPQVPPAAPTAKSSVVSGGCVVVVGADVVVVVGAIVVVVAPNVVVVATSVVVVAAIVVVVAPIVVVVAPTVVVVGVGAVVVVVARSVVVVGATVVVTGAPVVVVGACVVFVVDVTGTVVVLPQTNPPPGEPDTPHASQQLAELPSHAEPPRGARHFPGLDLIEHFALPRRSTRQHVTPFFLPHVEFAAHRMRSPLHSFGRSPESARSFPTCATQLTYCP